VPLVSWRTFFPLAALLHDCPPALLRGSFGNQIRKGSVPPYDVFWSPFIFRPFVPLLVRVTDSLPGNSQRVPFPCVPTQLCLLSSNFSFSATRFCFPLGAGAFRGEYRLCRREGFALVHFGIRILFSPPGGTRSYESRRVYPPFGILLVFLLRSGKKGPHRGHGLLL